MSTNYYLRKNYCQHCGRYDKIFFGRDLIGYKFMFELDDDHNNADDWISEILNPNNKIFDDNGREVNKHEFIEMIKSKMNEESYGTVVDGFTTDGKFDYERT